jgi:hypothetical protein
VCARESEERGPDSREGACSRVTWPRASAALYHDGRGAGGRAGGWNVGWRFVKSRSMLLALGGWCGEARPGKTRGLAIFREVFRTCFHLALTFLRVHKCRAREISPPQH